MPCFSIEVHLGYSALLFYFFWLFPLSLTPIADTLCLTIFFLDAPVVALVPFLQKLDAFLNHSTSNWCHLCSIQGNTQVWYTNLFVFQRPFQPFTDRVPTLNSYKVACLTTMQLFSFSSFDHLTSDQCFLSFIQRGTQVLYINVFVFQRPFQRAIFRLRTRYGSKVITITTTRVRFFTSFTLFSVNKTILKLC